MSAGPIAGGAAAPDAGLTGGPVDASAAPPDGSRAAEPRRRPFIAPGAMLGVLGGGQLGRMFAQAAATSGYRVAMLDPDPDSPAAAVAAEHVQTDYLDREGLARLGERCAAVTTEFENVPAAALEALGRRRVVAPAAAAVAVCQDRAEEKAAFARAGVASAPHAVVSSARDLDGVDGELLPGILKTARLGYDGKGQRRVADRTALAAAFAELGSVRCVLEKRLSLEAELSVIVARGGDGAVVALPVQENMHRDGILFLTRVPARIDAATAAEAEALARRVAASIGYVGVLCVEFFLVAGAGLVANEMAPRPHNSGHYSIDACDVSQFDLQVRALTGGPLATPRLHSPARMLNLLGDLWFDGDGRPGEPPWAKVLAVPGAHLHLYGKREARRGRKMGHLTLTAGDAAAAEENARAAAALLGLEGW